MAITSRRATALWIALSVCAVGVAALMSEPARAAPPDYLNEVMSPVYTTAGSAADITHRGAACVARTLAPGIEGGQQIVANDPTNGVLVANNSIKYGDGMLVWVLRSRFTVEAKDGRFRIDQTQIQRISDNPTRIPTAADTWQPVGKWRFSGWEKAQDALLKTADEVAQCVSKPEDSW